jgi:hypothetical protein
MAASKKGWDNISSLAGLSVDWDYQAENPFGKRSCTRIPHSSLADLLSVRSIAVKVVASQFEKTGELLDISEKGLAVALPTQLAVGQPVRIGFFLGTRKVISRIMVRNITPIEQKFRVGCEFIGLEEETGKYIAGLGAAKFYKGT